MPGASPKQMVLAGSIEGGVACSARYLPLGSCCASADTHDPTIQGFANRDAKVVKHLF